MRNEAIENFKVNLATTLCRDCLNATWCLTAYDEYGEQKDAYSTSKQHNQAIFCQCNRLGRCLTVPVENCTGYTLEESAETQASDLASFLNS